MNYGNITLTSANLQKKLIENGLVVESAHGYVLDVEKCFGNGSNREAIENDKMDIIMDDIMHFDDNPNKVFFRTPGSFSGYNIKAISVALPNQHIDYYCYDDSAAEVYTGCFKGGQEVSGYDKYLGDMYVNIAKDDGIMLKATNEVIDTTELTKNISIPVEVVSGDDMSQTVDVKLKDNSKIGWKDTLGNPHESTLPKGTMMVFGIGDVTRDPMYDIAEVDSLAKTATYGYLNMSNDNPVNNNMKPGIDKFDKELSIPVEIVDSSEYGEDRMCVKMADNYNIGWTGGYNDHHIERYVKGATYVVDKTNVTENPIFDVAKKAQSRLEKIQSYQERYMEMKDREKGLGE